MWEDGLSYRQTAAPFDIRDKSCVVDLERRYKTGGIDALTPRSKKAAINARAADIRTATNFAE